MTPVDPTDPAEPQDTTVPEGTPAEGPPRPTGRLYGLLADFDTPEELLAAATRVRDEGYRCFDAYTPYPIEEVNDVVSPHRSPLPFIVLGGGVVGAITGYALQAWTAIVTYPLNIGGRPLHSWPAFIPITFEVTILFAGLSAVLGMFALNKLPMPYHPVFNVPRFRLASRERYFLAVQAIDPLFDREATRALLASLSPHEVADVEP